MTTRAEELARAMATDPWLDARLRKVAQVMLDRWAAEDAKPKDQGGVMVIDMPWRCDVTGNPCGTDTRPVGQPCQCQGCRAAGEIERLEKLQEAADSRAEKSYQIGRRDERAASEDKIKRLQAALAKAMDHIMQINRAHGVNAFGATDYIADALLETA